MTNVGQLLLACRLEYVVNESRKILQAHLFLTEAPVFFLFRVQGRMVLSIPSATVVSEPDVVPLVSKNERRCVSRDIGGPEVHITLNTVHEEHSWLVSCGVSSLAWDPIELVNVTIIRNYSIRLISVAVLTTSLLKVSVVVVVSQRCARHNDQSSRQCPCNFHLWNLIYYKL